MFLIENKAWCISLSLTHYILIVKLHHGHSIFDDNEEKLLEFFQMCRLDPLDWIPLSDRDTDCGSVCIFLAEWKNASRRSDRIMDDDWLQDSKFKVSWMCLNVWLINLLICLTFSSPRRQHLEVYRYEISWCVVKCEVNLYIASFWCRICKTWPLS